MLSRKASGSGSAPRPPLQAFKAPLQESLWALGTAAGGAEHLVRYAEGHSWLGLTSYGLDVTETSTLAQLWFALKIHEVMELRGSNPPLEPRAEA